MANNCTFGLHNHFPSKNCYDEVQGQHVYAEYMYLILLAYII